MKTRYQLVLLALVICSLLTVKPCRAHRSIFITSHTAIPAHADMETGFRSILALPDAEIENAEPVSKILLAKKRRLSGLKKRKLTGLKKRKTTGLRKHRTSGLTKRRTTGLKKRSTTGLKGKYLKSRKFK